MNRLCCNRGCVTLGSTVGGAMLACSGARALALSLLQRRGGHGADGPLPLNHDVLWEARYFVERGAPRARGLVLTVD